MALVNFEGLRGSIIPAKHIYIIDKDHNLQEIKYEKLRDWWNQLFIDNVGLALSSTPVSIDIDDQTTTLFQTYLEFFKNDTFTFQCKAIYFIDNAGNAIEFINEIRKNWVDEYVLDSTATFNFIDDISNNVTDILVISVTNDNITDTVSTTFIDDIDITTTSDELDCTLDDVMTDSVSIVLTPI